VEPAAAARCNRDVRAFVAISVAAALSMGVTGSERPRVVAKITTGTAPCGAVVSLGSVWVANDDGTLVRINPKTNHVVRRIRVGAGSCSLAAGAGALWVANYKTGLLRVRPHTGRVRRIAVGATPFDVLVALGRVWVTAWGDGHVAEVHPHSLRVLRRIPVGAKPIGLIASHGAVWVGLGIGSSIARIDPAKGSVQKIEVHAWAPGWFVTGTRGFWIQAEGGQVVQVNPVTRRDIAHMHFGRTLAQGAAAPDGSIWIPDKEQSRVYRIDPERAGVTGSFAAGPGAYLALRAFGSMWVASYAGTDVWRFRP
jgi:streptogramin lyase